VTTMLKFVLKWLINGAIVVPLLMYYADVGFIGATLTATVLTVLAYLIGDQFILRSTNNIVATVSDAVLAFVFLWIVAYTLDWPLSLGEILAITAILGIAEWLIHRYVFQAESTVQAA